jgi:hypothetical protein
MVRDNSPKERYKRQLERKLNKRASYDRILIVSEGSKTEPLYFTEIRSAFKLQTANVQVYPSALGTSPLQVVNYAKELFENGDPQKRIQKCAFEQVYAVFDRDDHLTYHDALGVAESLDGKMRNDNKQSVSFKAAASVPSFELWLLLHFEDVHAPIHRDEVMRRLKAHFPAYEKGSGGTFECTKEHLNSAEERSARLAARFTAHDEPEPFTAVGEIVGLLTNLKK